MSWDVRLKDDEGRTVVVPSHTEGGVYALGGIPRAELNVTYNYSKSYRMALDEAEGLRWLGGRKAGACLERLGHAVNELGVERDEDYWAPTPGNAGYALRVLLIWAAMHPEATFEVV